MNKEGCFHSESENYKFWDTIQDQKLKELVESNKFSFKEIGKIMNRSPISCQSRSSRLGFKNLYTNKKYTVNEDFWAIPNLLNCYWAGFSAADCSIKKLSERNCCYILSLALEDKNHMEQLRTDVKFSGEIKIYKRNKLSNEKIPKLKDYFTCNLYITSNKWGQDLKQNFNIIPNKTHRLQPPESLNFYLLIAWLAGYISGDGTIHFNLDRKALFINFVSSSEYIIKWISEFMDKNFDKLRNRKSKYHKNKKYNCYHYSVAGLRAAILINYINMFKIPLLERKWKQPLILSYIKQKKQEFPALFIEPDPAELAKYLPHKDLNS